MYQSIQRASYSRQLWNCSHTKTDSHGVTCLPPLDTIAAYLQKLHHSLERYFPQSLRNSPEDHKHIHSCSAQKIIGLANAIWAAVVEIFCLSLTGVTTFHSRQWVHQTRDWAGGSQLAVVVFGEKRTALSSFRWKQVWCGFVFFFCLWFGLFLLPLGKKFTCKVTKCGLIWETVERSGFAAERERVVLLLTSAVSVCCYRREVREREKSSLGGVEWKMKPLRCSSWPMGWKEVLFNWKWPWKEEAREKVVEWSSGPVEVWQMLVCLSSVSRVQDLPREYFSILRSLVLLLLWQGCVDVSVQQGKRLLSGWAGLIFQTKIPLGGLEEHSGIWTQNLSLEGHWFEKEVKVLVIVSEK